MYGGECKTDAAPETEDPLRGAAGSLAGDVRSCEDGSWDLSLESDFVTGPYGRLPNQHMFQAPAVWCLLSVATHQSSGSRDHNWRQVSNQKVSCEDGSWGLSLESDFCDRPIWKAPELAYVPGPHRLVLAKCSNPPKQREQGPKLGTGVQPKGSVEWVVNGASDM